jgi:NADPH:quinone reductase-like Zn-dependent oxidoreductase
MKAVRLLEYGGQLVFNNVPTPTIARDEILVKIRSTAVNHLDLVEASGTARQILAIDLPWIPGHEFSGIVEQIGGDVAVHAPGDAVFGTTTGMGAYAEYVAVKAAAIAKKPPNLSFEEAASVPVAAQTGWQGIFTHGHLEKGQTILIHGGAGAVGAYAVQLASHAGARSLPLQAATMRRTSTPSGRAKLSIIERRSLRRLCERRSMSSST